jgi:hypothetical protein
MHDAFMWNGQRMLNLERKSFASTNVVSTILEHDVLHLVTSVISRATTQKFVSIFPEKLNSKSKKLMPRQYCYNNNLRKIQLCPK